MTYSEFCELETYKSMFEGEYKQLYPRLWKYLINKYKNYELLYPELVFFNQAVSLFEEYAGVLKDVEDALNIRNNISFTENNLGDIKVRKHKDIFTQTGYDSTNYRGYQVIGEYEREDSSNNTNRDINASFNEYNLLNALRNLENNGKRNAWFKFEKQFIKLFITLYTVNL